MAALAETIIETIRNTVAIDNEAIALHEPHFEGNEWNYVKECLDTRWVSSAGQYVSQFEDMLAEYTGMAHAVATVNGTSALHLALNVVGVKPGDEVIVPALCFVATANVVRYLDAIPHFADSEEKTLGLDPQKLEKYLATETEFSEKGCINKKTGRRIIAAVPMHTFGHPVDMEPLVDVCKDHHIALIEDCAESLGSLYRQQHTGNFGKAAAFSFNGNKIITTGGGGAILTNDSIIAEHAKHLSTTAKLPHRWEYLHDRTGFNYRLPNINAALGCAQMENLPNYVDRKRTLAERYDRAFKDIAGVKFFTEPPSARSNYWLNTLLLDASVKHLRDKVLHSLNAAGIQARPAWKLLTDLPMYKNLPRMDLAVAKQLIDRIINIPSSVIL